MGAMRPVRRMGLRLHRYRVCVDSKPVKEKHEMKISVMEITPDLAAEFLKRNTGNRVIRKTAVAQYVDDLRRGNWKLTHQGVAISPNGRLLDGQHRLFAIVQSGVSAQMAVAIDVPEDSYLVMDRGKPRKIRDVLNLDNRIVDPCAMIARLHLFNKSVEPHHAKEVIESPCGEAILEIIAACGGRKKQRTAAPIVAAIALRFLQSKNAEEYIKIQWRAFALSDFDMMSPAIKSYYRQIVDNSEAEKEQYKRLVRSWVAFDPKRENVTRIQINDADKLLKEMRDVWQPSWARA